MVSFKFKFMCMFMFIKKMNLIYTKIECFINLEETLPRPHLKKLLGLFKLSKILYFINISSFIGTKFCTNFNFNS